MDYESTDAKCPFYRAESSRKVSCEGYGCNRLTLTFNSPQRKREHKQSLCNTSYKSCEIYRLIMQKYGGEP